MCITHIYIYILSIYVTIEWYSSRTSTDSRLLQSIQPFVVGSHGGISRRNETLLDGAERGEKWPFWNGKTTVVNGVRFLLLVFSSRQRSRSALKIPGSEKSHSEASGVLILKENLLVYTQVVKLSRLFWTSLTYFGEKKFAPAIKFWKELLDVSKTEPKIPREFL